MRDLLEAVLEAQDKNKKGLVKRLLGMFRSPNLTFEELEEIQSLDNKALLKRIDSIMKNHSREKSSRDSDANLSMSFSESKDKKKD